MAIAAAPITHSRNIYDLLRQIVPPQEKVVDLYRRLLAINELSGSMNAARDVDSVIHFLAAYFLEIPILKFPYAFASWTARDTAE